MYRIDEDAVIILEVFQKKNNQTPDHIIDTCQQRMKKYDLVMGN